MPPQGGDTLDTNSSDYNAQVSIHASAREATRPCHRLDHLHGVSIHASAWEATASPLSCPASLKRFQSTPPHGRRPFSHASSRTRRVFQSTPPHGRRPDTARTPLRYAGFNPRLRTGGDLPLASSSLLASMFQSTPPHGRRPLRAVRCSPAPAVSIHASAREATHTPARRLDVPDGFQSTPPHGRRR